MTVDDPQTVTENSCTFVLVHGGCHRLGEFRLVQMPGSHEAIFTNPIGLADKLIEAGRD